MHQVSFMRRPAKPLFTIIFVTVAAFGIATVLGHGFVALAALLVGLVSLFVMAIAWMRPAGSQAEHHPKIDRLFDDTGP